MGKFRYHILSSFWIKVIALFLMTLDHISKIIPSNSWFIQICDIFGRFGFPLFILLLVEGVIHTRNFWKYFLRLGILCGVVLIAQIVIHHCFLDIYGFYSPLIDLLLCALTLYFLKQKNRKSFFAIIPISIIILSFVVMNLEEMKDIEIWWYPFYLRSGYNIFALLLSLGFFYAYPLAKVMMKNYNNGVNQLEGTAYERVFVNTIMCFVVFISVVIIYLISLIPIGNIFPSNESYALVSAVFIFLYSGELGYNKKWIKYGAYIYFPLHIVIIFAISLLF